MISPAHTPTRPGRCPSRVMATTCLRARRATFVAAILVRGRNICTMRAHETGRHGECCVGATSHPAAEGELGASALRPGPGGDALRMLGCRWRLRSGRGLPVRAHGPRIPLAFGAGHVYRRTHVP